MPQRVILVILVAATLSFRTAHSQEPPGIFQAFTQRTALAYRQADRIPTTLAEWNQRKATLRRELVQALGGFPETDCELQPRKLGEFQREGYRVEKLVFQTRPGIWMTANAYVPDQTGKRPAILHVHGHWSGAKQDPVVQSRCIGCAKLGFFVLAVDAFGSGERAIGKKLGEYHGEMTAATLLPVGLPLAGLQVYENKRAVDYLMTRPEVDSQRIGITGASGGGNQTMYAGALDERITCVVPTCSVGTYQSYLSAACCMCEVVPGGLKITEEGDILGLAANRGVMVTSATRDAYQFSVGEAKKSVARAEAIAHLYPGAEVRHTIIESPHAYNQPMREAMYGWMARNLKREGDGSPIPDPAIQPEDPELLRCYPGTSRPDDFVTIPRFAAIEAHRLAVGHATPVTRGGWEQERSAQRQRLLELLGGQPEKSPLHLFVERERGSKSESLTFDVEPGLPLVLKQDTKSNPRGMAIMLDLDGGADAAWNSERARQLRGTGWRLAALELRATGRYADPRDKIANAVDHNTAEWALWIGRPLLGQWVYDVRRALDVIEERHGALPSELLVAGRGSAAIVALCAAAIDTRIKRVEMIDSLSSYVTDQPFREVRLGVMVPGILRDFGDIAEMAALVAPRRLTISGGRNGSGTALDLPSLTEQFASTRQVYDLYNASDRLTISRLTISK